MAPLFLERLEDRTLLSASLVQDINPGPANAVPASLTNVEGTLYFSAISAGLGRELWKSNGSTDGTTLVQEINPSGDGLAPSASMTGIRDSLLFAANDGASGTELWKSDGTAAGTVRVRDIAPGSFHSSPSQLTTIQDAVFFTANDGSTGTELWKSDGTAAGTLRVRDIRPGGASSAPAELTAVNGLLFFAAEDGSRGLELWKSDGTTAGTDIVKDISPGGVGSAPTELTSVGGTLFFTANDGQHGPALWKSDGTALGTALVWPGPASNLTNVAGTLFFTADDGQHGTELWKSDGTAAGTVLVKDVSPGSASAAPTQLTNVGGTLFFTVRTASSDWQLWKSNGTTNGTILVKPLPAVPASTPGALTGVGHTLLLTVNDGSHGEELWTSDGTAAGTVLLQDIEPGRGSSSPSGFTKVNGTVFFSAGDAATGFELRAETLGTPVPGSVQFTSKTYSVTENAGSVVITVARTGGSDGPVSVEYFTGAARASGNSTNAGSLVITVPAAQDSADPVSIAYVTPDAAVDTDKGYTDTSGELTWADGETGNKSFTIAITWDKELQGDRTIPLTLENVTGGATLDTSSATVTVHDHELDDNTRFLAGLYDDILGQTPDANTLASLTAELDAAQATVRGQVGMVFVTSPENRANMLSEQYAAFLRRPASGTEVQYWMDKLAQGATPEQVLAQVLSAPEYIFKSGATDAKWLDQLYLDVLGRPRSAAETFGSDLRALGISQQQIAALVLDSPEARDQLIRTIYQALLDRLPRPEEMAYWRAAIGSHFHSSGPFTPTDQFTNAVVGSEEYFQKNGNALQPWIASLYNQVLDRSAAPEEIQGHLHVALDGFHDTRTTIVTKLLTSEDQREQQIVDLYSKLLQRAPTEEELAEGLGTLSEDIVPPDQILDENLQRIVPPALRGNAVDTPDSGASEQELLVTLVTSDEYVAKHGQAHDKWFDGVFRDLIGRPINPLELGPVGGLDSGRVTRAALVEGILKTTEYKKQVIADILMTYFGTTPTDAEAEPLLSKLERGVPAEELVIELLSSRDYFQAAQQTPS